MTLVELLVATTLLATVIALSTGFLIFALDKQSNLSQTTAAATSNQNGMETLSRVIRQGVYPTGSSTTSTILQAASATQLKVTSRPSSTGDALATPTSQQQIATATLQYTFTLSGTTLYWQQASVSCTVAGVCTYGTPSAQKPLIRGVQNLLGTAACPANTQYTAGLFQYVTINPLTNVPNTPTTTPSSLGDVAYVTVNLFTQQQTGPQTPACSPLSDYVQLRNKA